MIESRYALLALIAATALLAGCAPEVGSPKWCEKMREKPKAEWTLQETGDFAKHCIIP